MILTILLSIAQANASNLANEWGTSRERLTISANGHVESTYGPGLISGVRATSCPDSDSRYSYDECGTLVYSAFGSCGYSIATHFAGDWVRLELSCGPLTLDFLRTSK